MADPYPLGLDDMAVFAAVVEMGGFTPAAKRLGLRKSTVSRRVSGLEARLELRLLHRTTRQLRLTEVGERYYQRCVQVVAEARAAEEELREERDTPRGTLRVSTTPHLSELLAPMVCAYLQRYPGVQVEVRASWGRVDVLGEGFDVALRVGPLTASSLLARPLGVARSSYCASPDYLRARGVPRTPQELREHACLVMSDGDARVEWPFVGPGGLQAVPVSGPLRANNLLLVHRAVLAGLGIGRFPYSAVAPDVEAGRLVELLPGYTPPSVPLTALYPGSRRGSPKVHAFLELLVEHFQGRPLGAVAPRSSDSVRSNSAGKAPKASRGPKRRRGLP